MNRAIIVLVPLCSFLAACEATPPPKAVTLDCPTGPVAEVCPPGLDKRNKIKIMITPAGTQVTPPVVCASPATTITATVEAAASVPADFTVITVPKDAANDWIFSSRQGVGTMMIDVPAETVEERDYGYFVMTTTGQCLDPMIHVN